MTTIATHDNHHGQAIWLCRHGNRMDFVDPTWQGEDPPLSPDGEVQARETAAALRGRGIRHIFASPFLRTVQTASYIARELGLLVKVEHGASEWLREDWFPGGPHFLPLEELQERFGYIDTAYRPLISCAFPETEQDVIDRCRQTLDRLLQTCREDMLVVGHGASVHGLGRALLGEQQKLLCGLCALTRIRRYPDHAVLELNGDSSHLSGDEQHANRFH